MTVNRAKAATSKNNVAKTATSSMSPTNIKPLGDRVLIETLDARQTLKGGLIIPDTAQERPNEGRVIAVGAGRFGEGGELIVPEVKRGDTVLYGKYSGTEVKIEGVEGREYLMLREADILAIL